MESDLTAFVLFPELLSHETLVKILKHKFGKINANPYRIERWDDNELIDYAKRFLMPKPQRECRENQVFP